MQHEFDILSDLLPSRSISARKQAIAAFCWRSRGYLARFLAIQKWYAIGTRRAEKCGEILRACQNDAACYEQSADFLGRLSRETLALSKVPYYQIPIAVDVLTTGTYLRLPSSTRVHALSTANGQQQDTVDMVLRGPLPPDEETVLAELESALRTRLINRPPPAAMRHQFSISQARIHFHCEDAFDMTLTQESVELDAPFKLLELRITVPGADDESMLHALQLEYVQAQLQVLLDESDDDRALQSVYERLHRLTGGLKLEIAQAQLDRLHDEWGVEAFAVGEFEPCRLLDIDYWPEAGKCSLRLELDERDLTIRVRHRPPLMSKGAMCLGTFDLFSNLT